MSAPDKPAMNQDLIDALTYAQRTGMNLPLIDALAVVESCVFPDGHAPPLHQMNVAAADFAPFRAFTIGVEVGGGCERCAAVQDLIRLDVSVEDQDGTPLRGVVVVHKDDCPAIAGMEMSDVTALPPEPPEPPKTVIEALDALTGAQIPGGCDGCDAYQKMVRPDPESAVFINQIFHDDGCPTLVAHEQPNRAARRHPGKK